MGVIFYDLMDGFIVLKEALLKKIGIISLILFVVISFLITLLSHTYNFPFWDDFNQSLDFLNQYTTTTSLHEKVHLLVMQHNEHRIVFTRVMALLIFKVFGKLDFNYLLYIASFVQLLSVGLLINLNKRRDFSKLELIVFFLPLLFNLYDYDNFFWVPAGVQQLGQIYCSLLVLYMFINYLKTSSRISLFFCVMMSVINSFVSGGFLALYFTIIIYTFLIKRYNVTRPLSTKVRHFFIRSS